MTSYPQGPPGAGQGPARFVGSSPAPGRRGRFTAATGLSIGAAAIGAFLLFLKGAPALAYWAHLPIEVFYIVLIGGIVISWFVRRRWKRLLPDEERPPDIDHMEPYAARREAWLYLARLGFRALPVFLVVGVAAWIAIIQNGPRFWIFIAVGFSIFWSLAWAPLWTGVMLPAFRRR